MTNMHIVQFLVLVMTLFALEKNAVGEENLWTFQRAVGMWQNNSCIFPDKSLYQPGPLIPVPKLDLCRLLEDNRSSDKVVRDLCDAFYRMSFTICDTKYQAFVRECLNPELVEKSHPFAEKGVCSYVFGNENITSYFTFLKNFEQCRGICGEFSIMKPVCELYALIIYQFDHRDMCSTSEKQPENVTDKPKIEENPKTEPADITRESVTTPSTVTLTRSTSTTQLKGLTSENATLEQKHPETIKSSESSSTTDDDFELTPTVNGTQLDEALESKNDNLKASGMKSASTAQETPQPVDTPAPKKEDASAAGNDLALSPVSGTLHPFEASATKDGSNLSAPKDGTNASAPRVGSNALAPKDGSNALAPKDGSNALAPKDGSNASASNKSELEKTSLLISKITSAATAVQVDTETTTPPEEEITTTTESTTPEDVKYAGGNSDDTDEDEFTVPGDDDPQNESSWGQSNADKTVDDKNKKKTPGDNTGFSKVKLPEEFDTGKKQSLNTLEKDIENPAGGGYDDDSESSPGSGHFLAYFLTAVVICISGYVIYHNKQKILAFIIEGRHSGRGGRQRSKDVKYTQLKSNVEEVLPSLEQTSTGKNFVY